MTRVAFPLVLQSPTSGQALAGATGTITKHVVGGALGAGGAATIYTSETGAGVTGSNAITTDSQGRFTQGSGAGFAAYWLAQGTYDIAISGTGLTGYTVVRELFSAGLSDEVALAGEVKFGAWLSVPAGFLAADGTAYSRSTYAALFAAIALSSTGNTNATTTIANVPTATLNALAAITGATSGLSVPISGTNIPAGTTITAFNVAGQTLTLSQAASGTSTGGALVIAPYGVGDGSSTFNVPNLTQRVALGRATSGTGSQLGITGGSVDHAHSVPGLTVPGLTVPGLSIPGLSIPTLSIPSLTVAGLSIPGLSIPGLSVPGLAIPALGVTGTAAGHVHGLSNNGGAQFAITTSGFAETFNFGAASAFGPGFPATSYIAVNVNSISSGSESVSFGGPALYGNTDSAAAAVTGAVGAGTNTGGGTTGTGTSGTGTTGAGSTGTGVTGTGTTGTGTTGTGTTGTGTTGTGATGAANPPFQAVQAIIRHGLQ